MKEIQLFKGGGGILRKIHPFKFTEYKSKQHIPSLYDISRNLFIYLDVILDTTTMGQEAVVVKNGMRLCGTGAARGSSPILQDKAYWEVKIQQGGVWSVGIATPSADLNKVSWE